MELADRLAKAVELQAGVGGRPRSIGGSPDEHAHALGLP
jgi:hypothetical protein